MQDEYHGHAFDPRIAEHYGIPAAIIYQYIAYRARLSETGWVALKIDQIQDQCSYLGRKQVWSALQTLINSGKKTPSIVFRKQVQGDFLYAPACKAEPAADDDRPDTSSRLHWFDTALAEKFGIVASIFYTNVRYWIIRNWKHRAETLLDRLNPKEFGMDCDAMEEFAFQNTVRAASHYDTLREWLRVHRYISARSARRAAKDLVDAGMLLSRRGARGKTFWTLPASEEQKHMRNWLSESELENHVAKTNSRWPKGNEAGQKETRLAKRKSESTVSSTPATGSEAHFEAVHSEAVHLKQVPKSHNEFPPSDSLRSPSEGTSLSGAPAVELPAEGAPKLPMTYRRMLRAMNLPDVPPKSNFLHKDTLGNPVKRAYVRKPKPRDAHYEEYLEDLSPSERAAYEDQFRS